MGKGRCSNQNRKCGFPFSVHRSGVHNCQTANLLTTSEMLQNFLLIALHIEGEWPNICHNAVFSSKELSKGYVTI